MMRTKVPQRQMLPSSALLRLLRRRVRASSRAARPWPSRSPACRSRTSARRVSQKACCTGCSVLPSARPSTVRMCLALHLDGERRARVDGAAVDDHRAGAAGAAIADALVAGEVRRVRSASSSVTRGSTVSVWPLAVDGQLDRRPRRGRPCGRSGPTSAPGREHAGGERTDTYRFEKTAARDVQRLVVAPCAWLLVAACRWQVVVRGHVGSSGWQWPIAHRARSEGCRRNAPNPLRVPRRSGRLQGMPGRICDM